VEIIVPIRNSISCIPSVERYVAIPNSIPLVFDAFDPLLESTMNGLQLDDGNENSMDWDLPLEKEDGVDLELGEDDEQAYRDSEYPMEEGEGDPATRDYLFEEVPEDSTTRTMIYWVMSIMKRNQFR